MRGPRVRGLEQKFSGEGAGGPVKRAGSPSSQESMPTSDISQRFNHAEGDVGVSPAGTFAHRDDLFTTDPLRGGRDAGPEEYDVAQTSVTEDLWPGRLAHEVLRKLRLAPQADLREDRDTIFSEVFTDITGELDPNAQARLGAAAGTCFYEVLAQRFERDDEAAEELLLLCKSLWAHAFVGPIYALLLHRWLFSRPTAGGASERVKHLHVLVCGARDLFVGDAHGGCEKFRPLFHFFFYRVAFDSSVLQGLPTESQPQVLSVIAGFVPYYMPTSTLRTSQSNFPVPHAAAAAAPAATDAPERHRGSAFLLAEVARVLREMRSEEALLKYLRALQGLAGSGALDEVPTMVRVRLQIELYSLTTPGAPRWAPQSVRREALRTLDCLFPMGRTARRLVCFAFRVLHPGEVAQGWARWVQGWVSAPLRVGQTTATWAVSLTGWWVSMWIRAASYAVEHASGTPLPEHIQGLPLAAMVLQLMRMREDAAREGGLGAPGAAPSPRSPSPSTSPLPAAALERLSSVSGLGVVSLLAASRASASGTPYASLSTSPGATSSWTPADARPRPRTPLSSRRVSESSQGIPGGLGGLPPRNSSGTETMRVNSAVQF